MMEYYSTIKTTTDTSTTGVGHECIILSDYTEQKKSMQDKYCVSHHMTFWKRKL